MINREVLQQQDKLHLLNTTSLRLIPVLAEQSDIDGRVNINENEIKESGYMTPKLVPAAIQGLANVGLVHKASDGTMYVLYTCNTTPENKGFYYINLYKVFKKNVFKHMYKRKINLFYYLLTAKIPGTWHSLAVERLYKSKTFSGKVETDWFEDFDDLMNNFIPLIEAGIIEVKLGTSKSILTAKTTNIKKQIYTYCGKENLSARKKRMRGQRDTHILHIRIAEAVLKDKTTIFDEDRRSTLKDLSKIASEYDYSLDVFSEEALQEVHMTKYKIYDEFGKLGIQIYRESLRSFFEHSSHTFARLMNRNEFGWVIKNHYVIPRIKLELTSAIESAEKERNLSKTEAFLRYFTTEAYADDLVLFDKYMVESHSVLYENAKKNNIIWTKFSNKVDNIYQQERTAGHSKEIVLALAQKSQLSSKNRTIEELQIKNTNDENSGSMSSGTGGRELTTVKIPESMRKYRDKLIAKGLLGKDFRLPSDDEYDF